MAANWSALASEVDDYVQALAVHDDGGGAVLVAGGRFQFAGGVLVHQIAGWNGTSWSAFGASWTTLGTGFPDRVLSLAAFDDGSGPALIAGGQFLTSPAGDSLIAKRGCVTKVKRSKL